MSDRKYSVTPLIVGTVIAIIGILTGMYIAVNAREQLQAQTANSEVQTTDGGVQTVDNEGMATTNVPLPDLPAVDATPTPVAEDPVADDVTPQEPEVTTMENEVDEPDDFVPVAPEEIEQMTIPQDSL